MTKNVTSTANQHDFAGAFKDEACRERYQQSRSVLGSKAGPSFLRPSVLLGHPTGNGLDSLVRHLWGASVPFPCPRPSSGRVSRSASTPDSGGLAQPRKLLSIRLRDRLVDERARVAGDRPVLCDGCRQDGARASRERKAIGRDRDSHLGRTRALRGEAIRRTSEVAVS